MPSGTGQLLGRRLGQLGGVEPLDAHGNVRRDPLPVGAHLVEGRKRARFIQCARLAEDPENGEAVGCPMRCAMRCRVSVRCATRKVMLLDRRISRSWARSSSRSLDAVEDELGVEAEDGGEGGYGGVHWAWCEGDRVIGTAVRGDQ